MLITRCDRCGMEYNQPMMESLTVFQDGVGKIDLCSECRQELRRWLGHMIIRNGKVYVNGEEVKPEEGRR